MNEIFRNEIWFMALTPKSLISFNFWTNFANRNSVYVSLNTITPKRNDQQGRNLVYKPYTKIIGLSKLLNKNREPEVYLCVFRSFSSEKKRDKYLILGIFGYSDFKLGKMEKSILGGKKVFFT